MPVNAAHMSVVYRQVKGRLQAGYRQRRTWISHITLTMETVHLTIYTCRIQHVAQTRRSSMQACHERLYQNSLVCSILYYGTCTKLTLRFVILCRQSLHNVPVDMVNMELMKFSLCMTCTVIQVSEELRLSLPAALHLQAKCLSATSFGVHDMQQWCVRLTQYATVYDVRSAGACTPVRT